MKSNKKFAGVVIGTSAGLLLSSLSVAQEVANVGSNEHKPVQLPSMMWEPTFYLWLLLAIIVLATVFTLAKTVKVLTGLLDGRIEAEKSDDEFVPIPSAKQDAWSKFMRSMTRSVPVEKERDVLLDHDYDGIHELDNQLPPWWKMGFYLTIIFAVVYLFSYHLSGTGKLQQAEYEEQIAEAAQQQAERMANAADMVTADNVTICTDPAMILEGKGIFENNCAACHRKDAGGNVGPNLTDDFWIHGGGIHNLFKVITEGVLAKGMISWKSQLSPKQIREVASYVIGLRGSNPANPKEPQGDLWKEVVTKVDSGAVGKDSVKTAGV